MVHPSCPKPHTKPGLCALGAAHAASGWCSSNQQAYCAPDRARSSVLFAALESSEQQCNRPHAHGNYAPEHREERGRDGVCAGDKLDAHNGGLCAHDLRHDLRANYTL